MTTILKKIISGGASRPSRLHTERGDLIPVREMRHVPGAAYRKLSALVTKRRADEPWWPMSVIPVVDAFLNPSCSVIEFGSGSSTVWLARRAGSIVSIEDNLDWYRRTVSRLDTLGLCNADVKLAQNEDYFNLEHLAGRGIDLAIIDGKYRWRCVEAILPLMNSGGMVYLDNSDADKDRRFYPDAAMNHCAQQIMEEYAASNPQASLERFASIINGELHAGEGMLLRLSGAASAKRPVN
jgi:hypothetical protein